MSVLRQFQKNKLMQKMNWGKLKDLRCPSCGALLKVFENPKFPDDSMYQCTGCPYKIRNSKLTSIISSMKKPKLEPPEFIKKMRSG